MSKHHHHPNEGHSAGNPPKARHGPLFYLAGACIAIALICFIIWGAIAPATTAAPTAPPPAAAAK